MSGTSRPQDSGRRDSIGRRVMVSGTAAEQRASAPPPAAVGLRLDWDDFPNSSSEALVGELRLSVHGDVDRYAWAIYQGPRAVAWGSSAGWMQAKAEAERTAATAFGLGSMMGPEPGGYADQADALVAGVFDRARAWRAAHSGDEWAVDLAEAVQKAAAVGVAFEGVDRDWVEGAARVRFTTDGANSYSFGFAENVAMRNAWGTDRYYDMAPREVFADRHADAVSLSQWEAAQQVWRVVTMAGQGHRITSAAVLGAERARLVEPGVVPVGARRVGGCWRGEAFEGEVVSEVSVRGQPGVRVRPARRLDPDDSHPHAGRIETVDVAWHGAPAADPASATALYAYET